MKKRHKNIRSIKRRLAALLSLALLFAPLSSAALKAETPAAKTGASAEQPAKKEVVFGKLSSSGKVEQLYVMNHFDLKAAAKIKDYGDYSSVVPLGGTDDLTQSGEEVTADFPAGNWYYQGNLKSKELPWLIDVSYRLNGQSTGADQLSGQSGELEIRIKSEKNPKGRSEFYENYVLQIMLQIDLDKADDITAEGATLANAGQNTAINYMVLPGKNADHRIKMTIKNFAMPGITINALPLTMAFEWPKLSDEFSQLTDLQDGIAKLSDGVKLLADNAALLRNGITEIQVGSGQLAANSGALNSGADQLSSGIQAYANGIDQYVGAVSTFSGGMDELAAGSSQLSKLTDLAAASVQIKEASSSYLAGLEAFQKQLVQLTPPDSGSADMEAKLQQLNGALDAISAASTQQKEGLALLAANAALIIDKLNQLPPIPAYSESDIAQLQAALAAIPESAPPTVPSADLAAGLGLTAEELATPAVQKLLAAWDQQNAQLNAFAAGLQGLSGLKSQLGSLLQLLPVLGSFSSTADELKKFAAGVIEASNGYTELDAGIQKLTTEIKPLLQALNPAAQIEQAQKLKEAVQSLVTGYQTFNGGLQQYAGGVESTVHQLSSAESGSLLDGISSLAAGARLLAANGQSLKNSARDLAAGATESASGNKVYTDGVNKLNSGLIDYAAGITDYEAGAIRLASGAKELKDGTADMNTVLEEKIREQIAKYLPQDFQAASFVSAKNTKITSVQFTLMTAAVAEPKKEEAKDVEAEAKSFWDRVLDLFR